MDRESFPPVHHIMLGKRSTFVWVFAVLCRVHSIICAVEPQSDVVLYLTPSSPVVLVEETVTVVNVYGESQSNLTQYVHVEIQDEEIARVAENATGRVIPSFCYGQGFANVTSTTTAVATSSSNISPSHCFNLAFSVKGLFLGKTRLMFYGSSSLLEKGNEGKVLNDSYIVIVVRPETTAANVYSWLMLGILVLQNIAFGLTIDVREMVKLLKKPIPPVIGLCCQFVINPLTAYGIIRIFDISPSMAIGLFTMGCSPGGGASNVWSYLHRGDMDLSILMTFISTMVALGMMPLWLYTLGRTIIDSSVTIPFVNIIISLLALVCPCIVGVLIKRFFPKAAKIILRIFKPILVMLMISLAVAAIIANLFFFQLMKDWRVPVSSLLLPYTGYIISACVAWATRQPWKRIKTIAIETAFQNVAIAVVMLRFSLPQPDADLSCVLPVVAAIFTPLPMWISFVVLTIWRRCCKRQTVDPTCDKELEENYENDKTEKGSGDKDTSEEGQESALDMHTSRV